jgi:hypothetical protein
MNEREVRMRSIEALSAMGVRETQRLVRDAEVLKDWVMAAEETAEATKATKRKNGDKDEAVPS